jgi:hypothetical protein
MKNETLINTLKEHYPRDVRKQLVKSMLEVEKKDTDLSLEQPYKMINQIFSYVLHENGWEMGDNSKGWNDTPLKIMNESFPKLSTTKWYKEQTIEVEQNIDIVAKD